MDVLSVTLSLSSLASLSPDTTGGSQLTRDAATGRVLITLSGQESLTKPLLMDFLMEGGGQTDPTLNPFFGGDLAGRHLGQELE